MGASFGGPFFMCPFCSILAPFCLSPTCLGLIHYRMLYEVQMIDGQRFITQDEALSILAEVPYEAQLYEVLNWIGATRYQIDFTRNGKLVARVGAKRKVDVMDAMFLAPELRLRLLAGMKTVQQHAAFR